MGPASPIVISRSNLKSGKKWRLHHEGGHNKFKDDWLAVQNPISICMMPLLLNIGRPARRTAEIKAAAGLHSTPLSFDSESSLVDVGYKCWLIHIRESSLAQELHSVRLFFALISTDWFR